MVRADLQTDDIAGYLRRLRSARRDLDAPLWTFARRAAMGGEPFQDGAAKMLSSADGIVVRPVVWRGRDIRGVRVERVERQRKFRRVKRTGRRRESEHDRGRRAC